MKMPNKIDRERDTNVIEMIEFKEREFALLFLFLSRFNFPSLSYLWSSNKLPRGRFLKLVKPI